MSVNEHLCEQNYLGHNKKGYNYNTLLKDLGISGNPLEIFSEVQKCVAFKTQPGGLGKSQNSVNKRHLKFPSFLKVISIE